MAVVHEFNDTYKVYDWNVYIINDKPVDLEMVILVSKGYSEDKKTATFRKKIEVLPAKSNPYLNPDGGAAGTAQYHVDGWDNRS